MLLVDCIGYIESKGLLNKPIKVYDDSETLYEGFYDDDEVYGIEKSLKNREVQQVFRFDDDDTFTYIQLKKEKGGIKK